ncbi:MAG TPA: DNA starvation/stationary phase protection protein [Phycisphaerales bacterium]|nr:DNA starvation/stationary phase protection protein [Phycisphaerales bacterium]HMP36757.1 DNA starvation/stationary phase protection protein [Phycisphaerales bacterium]
MARRNTTRSSTARKAPPRKGTSRNGAAGTGAGARTGKGSATGRRAQGSGGLALRRGGSAGEIQPFGAVVPRAIALPASTCAGSIADLNSVLADTMALRDLYRKCHWQVSGMSFTELHELFDRHYGQQDEIVDLVAERIAMLGGVSVAMPHDVAEATSIPRPPLGRESAPAQLQRLLDAHEIVIRGARRVAGSAADRGDDGTNDLVVGQVIRTNEKQAWFVAEHANGI